MTLDGALDDAGWRGIPWTAGFRRFLGPEHIIPQRTLVKAAWDDRCLYVAFRVYDTDSWATMTARDDRLWEEEVVEIYIDEDDDQLNYREFEINPLGTMLDALIPKAGDQRDTHKVRLWNAAGRRAAARPHWVAETAFPWGIFTHAKRLPPQPGHVWRIQFYRAERERPGSEPIATSWSPTPNFHVPERFGRILFVE